MLTLSASPLLTARAGPIGNSSKLLIPIDPPPKGADKESKLVIARIQDQVVATAAHQRQLLAEDTTADVSSDGEAGQGDDMPAHISSYCASRLSVLVHH